MIQYKKYAILSLCLLIGGLLNGQKKDSLVGPRHPHLKANISHVTFNVLLNRVNRYFIPTGKDWSDVSLESWKENLGQLPSWDWDLYTTNWFAHPYQGALYYNAGRSLKMSYLESMAYAGLGTAMWEYLGEDLPPSSNDFVTNILGGIYLGEIMFRLSENILDDRATGGNRRKREIYAAFVNPMGAANRLLYGQLSRHETFKNHIEGNVETKLWLSTTRMLSSSRTSNQAIIPQIGIDLKYDKRDNHKNRVRPFEIFWLQARLRLDSYDQENQGFQVPLPALNISSTAVIIGRRHRNRPLGTSLTALYQDYDFLNTFTYKFSAIRLSLGSIHEYEGDKFRILGRWQAGVIPLAAVGSSAIDWVRPEDQGEERDYIMGHGFSAKIGCNLYFSDDVQIENTYDIWYIPVRSGPEGTETIHRYTTRAQVQITKKLSLGLTYNYFYRDGHYPTQTQDVSLSDHNSEVSFAVFYNF